MKQFTALTLMLSSLSIVHAAPSPRDSHVSRNAKALARMSKEVPSIRFAGHTWERQNCAVDVSWKRDEDHGKLPYLTITMWIEKQKGEGYKSPWVHVFRATDSLEFESLDEGGWHISSSRPFSKDGLEYTEYQNNEFHFARSGLSSVYMQYALLDGENDPSEGSAECVVKQIETQSFLDKTHPLSLDPQTVVGFQGF